MIKKIARIINSSSFKNSFWSILEATSYPIVLVIATPLFLDKLGVENYGLWMLANSIILSIGVLNIGLGDATIKYVSKYNITKNVDRIRSIIQVNFTVYSLLAVLTFVVGLFISFIIFRFSLFDISEELRKTIIFIIPIGSFTLGIKFIEQILLAVFKGFERYDKASKLFMFSKFLVIIINIIVVLTGKSLIWVFFATMIFSLIFLLIEMYFLKLFFRDVSFYPRIEKGVFREVFEFGIWAWIQSVVTIISSQMDKFIVAQYVGLKVLAFYSLGTMIFNQLHAVFSAAASWLFPKISAKTEKKESTISLFNQARFVLITVSMTLLLLLLLSGKIIFPLWLGEETYKQSRFFLNGFIAYEGLVVLSIVPYYFMLGSGAIKYNTLGEVGFKIFNIICMILLFYSVGINGILYGLILSIIVYIPIQNRLIQRVVFNNRKGFKMEDFLILSPSIGFLLIVYLDSNYKYLLIPVVAFLIKTIFFDAQKKQSN